MMRWAIEAELQTNYGYSLQMRASGNGSARRLPFNVKAGHCEYFATALWR